MKALLSQFALDDFVWEYKLDTGSYIMHLFFAACCLLRMYLLYPEVLLLDYTYKTNQYGLPLLGTVGVAGVEQLFLVNYAFVSSESELDFAGL
jgi:hypothetical protein